jgi:hypothetical protein
MNGMKQIGGVVSIILLGYVIVLPMLWSAMPPTAEVNIPAEWPHDQDMPLQVDVSALHPNYTVVDIRFYVDNPRTSLEGAEEPFYAVSLLQRPSKPFSMMNPLRRLTYPTGETIAVTVPFARLAGEKVTGPGVVVGTLDIQIDHPGSRNRYNNLGNQTAPEKAFARIPFNIRLN